MAKGLIFFILFFCQFFFAHCALAGTDIDDLADRVSDLEIMPSPAKITDKMDAIIGEVQSIKVEMVEGRVDLKHLIKQLEVDHELIMKNTDGILLLGNRVLVLERMVPENERRIIRIENKEKKQEESVKKLLVSALTSTVGIIGGIAVFLISIIKAVLSYRTNKKNQELLERIAGAKGE